VHTTLQLLLFLLALLSYLEQLKQALLVQHEFVEKLLFSMSTRAKTVQKDASES
jgi:hypothetical protein